jgi:hypothetical protein
MRPDVLAWELNRYRRFKVWELLHATEEEFLRDPQHYVIRAVREKARYDAAALRARSRAA